MWKKFSSSHRELAARSDIVSEPYWFVPGETKYSVHYKRSREIDTSLKVTLFYQYLLLSSFYLFLFYLLDFIKYLSCYLWWSFIIDSKTSVIVRIV